MGEALAISPEKLAFIQVGAQPAAAKTSLPAERRLVGARGAQPTEIVQDEARPPPDLRAIPDGTRLRDERHAAPAEPPLVPLTTRLQAETADALRRAHLEQRLRRQTPDTVQEIVEEGVARLLREMGYLR